MIASAYRIAPIARSDQVCRRADSLWRCRLNPRPSRTGFLLLCLLALALGVRVKAADWVQRYVPPGARFVFGDSESYWELGRSIAAGDKYSVPFDGWFDRQAFRTPGYPLLLAGMFYVVGRDAPVIFARYINAILGTLAVGAVYWLASRLFDAQTALFAGAVAAIYPGAIAASAFVLSEAPFCPLMIAQLATQVAAWQVERRRTSFVLSLTAGILAGAATIMRPSWLLFVPFAMACGIAFSRPRLKHFSCGVCMVLGVVVVMAPWWVRNFRLTSHFIPTSLQVGASLYDGLNPQAEGNSEMSMMDAHNTATVREVHYRYWELFDAGKNRQAAELAAATEYELDRHWRDEALSWAREHPARVLQLTAIKFSRMWNVWPNESQFRSWPVRLAVFFSYVPIMILAIWGAWKFRDRGWPCVLCWLPAVYLTLLHMVFVSSIRYREPAMLPLIVLAAGTAVSWWQSKKGLSPKTS